MAEKKVMLTQDGYDELVKKLDYLKSVRRIEVADRLKAAIALGDLSENSEYDDAKNEQAFLEGEIFDLEAQIVNSQIIQAKSDSDTIDIGNTVVIREVEEVTGDVYCRVNKIYKVVDGTPQEITDKPEATAIVYKLDDSDFIDVGLDKAYKLINVTVEEVTDKSKADEHTYRLIEGALVQLGDEVDEADSKVYKLIAGESENIYGTIENVHKVYKIVDEDEKYRIVGTTETDPDEGKISDESPLGAALMGKKAGNIAEVNAPVGIILYEIVKIES